MGLEAIRAKKARTQQRKNGENPARTRRRARGHGAQGNEPKRRAAERKRAMRRAATAYGDENVSNTYSATPRSPTRAPT